MAVAAAAVAATLASPLTATALLRNDYGQVFTGQATCTQQRCHDTNGYDRTTHSDFANPMPEPAASATGMWPAGRPGIGLIMQASDVAFRLGANTGAREYLWFRPAEADTATGPVSMTEGLEWDPAAPSTWEYGAEGLAQVPYNCGQCHHLGYQRKGLKPLAGSFAGSAAATRTGWALDPADDRSVKASWVKGASIQCERCHGTGKADVGTLGHWTSGVQIVGGWSSTQYGQKSSQRILDSQACGQCHGTYAKGTIIGYTPDATLTDFVTPYGFDAIPDAAAFEASAGLRKASKFYPSGQNKAMKHSYYSEWTLSAHSRRGALTSASPAASVYQKTGAGHFTSTRGKECNRCHTGEGFLKRKGAWIMSDWVESTATAGRYGQECVVCHYSHKSDGTGLSVREPDAAGVGSAAGHAQANQSMCEDCHNWQVEITGVKIANVPSGRGPSHPQREIRHGVGLNDVAPAGQFMPGAKCEHCHMPATKSDFPNPALERYGDQSWKRYSHRMKIMMPGDAAKWGLGAWGDSCSPCHPSRSQADLQSSIVSWQAQCTAAAAKATAAFKAASARAASATPGGVELMGRSYINQRYYINDASGGAHNPPYILAGLRKAEELARSVGGTFGMISAPRTPVAIGTISAIAGSVRFGDGGVAAGQQIVLETLSGASWVAAGSTRSDANGNFAFMVSPTAATTYRLRWDRSSAAVTRLVSAPFAVTVVVPDKPTTITIRTNTTSVLLSQVFVLSGNVTPSALVGKVMHVDVKRPGSAVWIYSSARGIMAGAGGTAVWAYGYKPVLRGTYTFRAVFDGGSGYAKSSSGTVAVAVR